MIEILFNMDKYLMDFVNGNVITIGLLLYLGRSLSKLTPSTRDDGIVEAISGAFQKLTGRKDRGAE